MRVIRRALIAATALVVAACGDHEPTLPSIRAAAGGGSGGVSVTATTPDSATQDTTLDVVVGGSGFDQGSQAQWAISGVPSTKVRTNSTTYVGSKKLIANITIAADADTGLYDVIVTASTGKKGIGSELFSVRPKNSGRGPSGHPDPVLAFFRNGSVGVMTASGSDATIVYSGDLGARPPSWSPLGEETAANPYRLVFETNAGTCPISTIDIDTVGGVIHASNLQALSIPGYDACSPSWSPVGDSIVFGGAQPNAQASGLFLVSTEGGPVVRIYSAPLWNSVFWPDWRSNGDAIAFVELNQENRSAIKVLNRETGVVTTVVDFGEFGFTILRSVSWARTRDVLAFGVLKPNYKWETDTVPLVRDGTGNFMRAAAPARVFNDYGASWSPDDSHLVFNGITVLDLATGRTQKLGSGEAPNWRR